MTIGFYSHTQQLGGSEVYLKILLPRAVEHYKTVLFYCNRAHPLLTDEQIKRFIEAGQIKVVCIKEDKEEKGQVSKDNHPSNQERRGVSPKEIILKLIPRSVKLYLGTKKEIQRIKTIFENKPVDLIHFNDTGCEPPVISAGLAGIQHITGTLHVLPAYDKEKTDWVHQWIERKSLKCMTRIIAVSQAAKEAWAKRTGINPEKIKVIYNGIDFDKFAGRDGNIKDELNLKNELVIGVPARLHPMKGHTYFIKAIPIIKEKVGSVKVLFLGEGPIRKELEAEVKALNLEDTIIFLGHREDVVPVLNTFDVSVLPSVTLETFGLAAVEAMACGKPVVATNFSGFPEVVEDGVTGMLVPVKDPESLAEAVVDLLSDQNKARQMGEAGKNRVKKYFTQEQMLKETISFFEQC